MSSSSTNINSILIPVAETDLSRQIKFDILLPILIPSIVCSFFLLYHLIFNRTNRQALHNHVMVALLMTGLIVDLVDIPMVLNYLRTDLFTASTSIGCLIWNFFDITLYGLISLLMLWASIERHILIFHDQLVSTKQRRRLIHYAPLIIIPTYMITFYFIIIFLYPCKNVFDYSKVVCGATCFYIANPALALFDQLAHSTIPAILIALFNMALLVRVIWQKHYRMRQSVGKLQHRRMILQLIPVSILYLCGVVPYGMLNCIHMFGIWTDVGTTLQLHFFYLFYLMAVFLPFICLLGMPNVYSKVSCKRQIQVAPNTPMINRQL